MKEKLAQLAHEQWSGWIKYMFSKGVGLPGGGIYLPAWAVERWTRQAFTPYANLSDSEKDSDRAEADKFLAILKQK